MNANDQARIMARALGSTGATVRIEHRNADGTLTVEESGSWTRLTAGDLSRALEDERHLGFGYRSGRSSATESRVSDADAIVLRIANEKGWTYEQLFAWANSRPGRWTADVLYDGGTEADVRRWDLMQEVAE